MIKSLISKAFYLALVAGWMILTGANPVFGILTLAGAVVIWLVVMTTGHIRQGWRVEAWEKQTERSRAREKELEAERALEAIRRGATTP